MTNNIVTNTPTVCNSKRSITNTEHNQMVQRKPFRFVVWPFSMVHHHQHYSNNNMFDWNISLSSHNHNIFDAVYQRERERETLCVTHHVCLHEWDFVWIRFTSNWATRIREFLFVQFICRKCSRSINSNLHTCIHKLFAFSQTPVWLRT